MWRSAIVFALAGLIAVGSVQATVGQLDLSEPVGFGGRIEVPEAGYALTLPADWLYIRPTGEDLDVILDATLASLPTSRQSWQDR
jgi:hypothetical protein